MTLTVVKEKLHDYIDHADGKKVKALYAFMENDLEPEYEFTDEDMKELDKRWDDYLSGKSKSYTLEETRAHIKSHRENRRQNGV